MARAIVKVDSTSERNPSARDPEKRSRQFSSVLLMGLFGVPAFGLLLRLIVFFSPEVLPYMGWLVIVLLGVGLPVYILAMNKHVAKRVEFVAWHAAATAFAFATATYFNITLAWPPVTAPWYSRLVAVVHMPAWWIVTYLVFAVFVSLTWLMNRLDSFRAKNSERSEDDGSLAKLLGLPTGAKVRAKTIDADEYAVTAKIDHPTVPADNVAKALPAMVEYAGAVRGRSTIIPDERGGSSTVRIVKTDPMKDWRTWPGLSHPGGTFAYPIRTAYYSTGEMQWYSFARTPEPDEYPASPVATEFRAPNDAHLGRQGATRAGKSGDTAIEIAEVASRRDAVLVLVNLAKLRQDAGWCLDFATLLADKKARAKVLLSGLRSLGEFRSDVMGDLRYEGRHRTWTPLTYDELGFAAVFVQVDEGDLALSGADVTWLSTKGLSLGIYLSVSISRAVTDGMASTLRSAIPTWKAFGAGQDYDGGFALSDETIKRGADPSAFGTRFPGAHYLDKAGGVAETLYPVDARSFKTRRDFGDLRAAVEAARATFTPATLTPEEIKAFGEEAYEYCRPRAVLFGAAEQQEDQQEQTQGATFDSPPTRKELPVPEVQERYDTGDPELDELMNAPRVDFAAIGRELGMEIPPLNEDVPNLTPPELRGGGEMEGGKRRVSAEETIAEFDAALIRMAQRGVEEFSNADVMEEMQVAPSPTWVSRRFKQICEEGKQIAPPGLMVERLEGRKHGRFRLTRIG